MRLNWPGKLRSWAKYLGFYYQDGETVLFRIVGKPSGDEAAHDVAVYIESTQQARELAVHLLTWANSRDDLITQEVERSECERCGRMLMFIEDWYKPAWMDEWMNDICGIQARRQPHVPRPPTQDGSAGRQSATPTDGPGPVTPRNR